MKKTKKSTFSASGKIAGIFSALFSLVAIFTMFADAFNEEGGSARGSFFHIMFFGNTLEVKWENLSPIWPLVIAFALALVAVFLAVASTMINGMAKKGALIGAFVANAGTIALAMFECQFYEAGTGVSLATTGETYVGAAPICIAVFCGLALLIDAFAVIYKPEAE